MGLAVLTVARSAQHWACRVGSVSVCFLKLGGLSLEVKFPLFPHDLHFLPASFSLGLQCLPLKQEGSIQKVRLSTDLSLLYTLKGRFPADSSLKPNSLSFLKLLFLFLAVLSLCGHAQAFSSCVGLLSSCSVQASPCSGFSYCGTHTLDCMGSVVVAHGLSFPMACGIFPDHRSNLSPLHGKVDFY